MTADGYATDQDQRAADPSADTPTAAELRHRSRERIGDLEAENARLRAEVAARRADLAALREWLAAALDAEAAVWRSMAIVGLSAADVADTLEGFAAAVRNGTPAPPLVDEQEGE